MMKWLRRGAVFFGFCMLMLMMGCATGTGQAPPAFDARVFDADGYVPKVDDFMVILDASSSMGRPYNGTPKFQQAVAGVELMNETLPELDYNGGLRTFGHHPSVSKDMTVLQYGLADYTTGGFKEGLEKSGRPGGTSPMGVAIHASEGDLAPTRGDVAVIIVSDGVNPALDAPLKDAENIKQALGDRLCIYTIQVGDDPEGAALLENIAKKSACGFSTTMDRIYSEAEMANFVEKVFLAKAPPKPVPEPVPEPPPVEADAAADGAGREARGDADGDGVYDDEDECPTTPMGARVDSRGCWAFHSVLFDFDKAVVKPEFHPMLDNVVRVLNENPDLGAEIQGHTDNVGTEAYNKNLSRERANAILNYLVEKGIAADRLTAVGFWYSQPIATNDTEEGRAENRRVQFKPIR